MGWFTLHEDDFAGRLRNGEGVSIFRLILFLRNANKVSDLDELIDFINTNPSGLKRH
jgi:hypothetical protein